MKQGQMNFITAGYGLATVMQAVLCVRNLMDYSAAKAVALEKILQGTPEVSQQVYQAAVQTAHNMASGNYHAAIFAGSLVVSNAICAYFWYK